MMSPKNDQKERRKDQEKKMWPSKERNNGAGVWLDLERCHFGLLRELYIDSELVLLLIEFKGDLYIDMQLVVLLIESKRELYRGPIDVACRFLYDGIFYTM